MSDSPLIFLHVTKTAGGTLKAALRNLPGRRVEMVYGPADKDRLADTDLSGVDMIYGHVIFGLHEKLKIAPKYACFMRHPVTRTISHYYHLRNVEGGPVGDLIRASADINDFFARHRHWEFSNLITKIVSGSGNDRVPDEPAMLDHALANVAAHFSFIGFQEFFPISLRKLSQDVGQDIVTRRDANIGHYDLSSVSAATLDKIVAMNQLDLALYKASLARFL